MVHIRINGGGGTRAHHSRARAHGASGQKNLLEGVPRARTGNGLPVAIGDDVIGTFPRTELDEPIAEAATGGLVANDLGHGHVGRHRAKYGIQELLVNFKRQIADPQSIGGIKRRRHLY